MLRAGSVFGQAFWRGGVCTLLGADARDATDELEALVDAELLERRTTSKFPGESEYVFRHALVRDAAYSMFTADDRRTGHRLAGAWLEDKGAHDPLVLAEHFELGAVPHRAIEQLRRAAELALEGNDFEAVLGHVERQGHVDGGDAVEDD